MGAWADDFFEEVVEVEVEEIVKASSVIVANKNNNQPFGSHWRFVIKGSTAANRRLPPRRKIINDNKPTRLSQRQPVIRICDARCSSRQTLLLMLLPLRRQLYEWPFKSRTKINVV